MAQINQPNSHCWRTMCEQGAIQHPWHPKIFTLNQHFGKTASYFLGTTAFGISELSFLQKGRLEPMLGAAGLPNLLGLLDVQLGARKLWEPQFSMAELLGSCRPSVPARLSDSHTSNQAQIQGNLACISVGIYWFRWKRVCLFSVNHCFPMKKTFCQRIPSKL